MLRKRRIRVVTRKTKTDCFRLKQYPRPGGCSAPGLGYGMNCVNADTFQKGKTSWHREIPGRFIARLIANVTLFSFQLQVLFMFVCLNNPVKTGWHDARRKCKTKH